MADDRITDPSPLKRSFDILHENPSYTDFDCDEGSHTTYHCISQAQDFQFLYGPSKKRPSISSGRPSGLPMQAASVMSDTFPSFMSVFQSQNIETNDYAANNPPTLEAKNTLDPLGSLEPSSQQNTESIAFRSHHHRGSITSNASDSTQSSPSISNSTFDSPALTEPSPSSSPESPNSAIPLSPFRSTMTASDSKPESTPNDGLIIPEPVPVPPRSTSPSSGIRNLKNLTLSMNVIPTIRPATSMGLETSAPFSAPASPSKEPLRTGRRKPTNLTIRTPGFQQLNFPRPLADIPPTPSHRPNLQHYKSSPSLTSLASATAPKRLFLPIPSLNTSDIQSQSLAQPVNQSLPELREEDESHPLRSKEAPERGYPGGPIQIYDSGVWLYLEPTSEEASHFDTVINVAKEIKNPFLRKAPESNTVMSIWRSESTQPSIPEPQTAVSDISFKSAFEWPTHSQAATPTTPKASRSQNSQPEYLHVQWDHNSEIVEDLYPLCKLIDDRVKAGKKVLIHCQLGVSRSASLVIAYGLYKGYQPDFHSMYMAVKERSQWVGPNMSLIYQLTDFRSKVARGEYQAGGGALKDAWFRTTEDFNKQSQTPVAAPTVPPKDEAKVVSQNTSRLSQVNQPFKSLPPLPFEKSLPPVPLNSDHGLPSNLATPPQDDLSSTSLAIRLAEERLSTRPLVGPQELIEATKSVKRVAPVPLPLRQRRDFQPAPIPAFKPGFSHLPGLSFSSTSSHMDLASQNEPPTPSLFSPRATEFIASPFGMTTAGDLAAPAKRANTSFFTNISSRKPTSSSNDLSANGEDPRSPHQRNDNSEIVRSIDDVL